MSSPSDIFGLTEIIEGFTFRNQGGIKILKKWREEAVIMQLDVEIVSVIRDQFVNYRSLPSSGSYGFATLIFRDFCLPSIQLTQSRQTIYYATNEFAQSAWMEFHQMIRLQENFQGIEQLICFNTGLLGGACIPKECKPIPQPSFIEFPLREIFVKADLGTQFNVELSYWKINDIIDNCGNLVFPKSNQNDADKDEGLPPFGTAPRKAPDQSNPFSGLPPVSPLDREGIISDNRINDLDDVNPDNIPPDSSAYGILWGWSQSCRPSGIAENVAQAVKYSNLLPDDIISASIVAGITCNADQAVRMTNQRTGEVYGEFYTGQGFFLSANGSAPAAFIVRIDSRDDWLN